MDDQKIPLMVPDVGEVSSIELIEWHVAPGDTVRQGQELCELVTDKAAFPLESPFDGVLAEILKPQGSWVNQGDTLAILQLPAQ